MLFTDHFFLLYFFPAVFLLHFFLYRFAFIRLANLFLIATSLFFYSTFSVGNVIFFLVTLVLDYIFAFYIFKSKDIRVKRFLLFVGIVTILSFLVYFKYGIFIGSMLPVIPFFGSFFNIHQSDLIIPVGISFITFQRISYIVDIYRNNIKPEMDIVKYATYASLFPHLIAGPIVRYSDISKDLSKRLIDVSSLFEGMVFVSVGLAFKVMLADTLFPFEQILKSDIHSISGLEAWLLMFTFSLRIYFDFSGYSLMAIGLARLLGFHFPHNFSAPYRSENIRGFWRSWNITLSRWLRDYVYIPLGGNRNGSLRMYRNIMITMLIGGLWHGASWNFVFWGGIHGVYQIGGDVIQQLSGSTGQRFGQLVNRRQSIVNRVYQVRQIFPLWLRLLCIYVLKKIIVSSKCILVFMMVSFAWLGFVFHDWQDMWLVMNRLTKINMADISALTHHKEWYSASITGLIGMLVILFFREDMLEQVPQRLVWVFATVLLFLISLAFTLQSGGVSFIYFQF